MNKWLESLITFIYPAQCRACETQMGVERTPYICDSCWERVDYLRPPWCRICGFPFAVQYHYTPPGATLCRSCARRSPPYGKLRSIAFYTPTMREVIHLFKYKRKHVFEKHLIALIYAHLPDDIAGNDYDFLVPIPLHKNRHRSRGFNQAESIAKGLATVWKIPIRTDILVRIKDTAPQSNFYSTEEREANIEGAFAVQDSVAVEGQRILLIDDIFTTGTTINESISMLKQANPQRVDVFTLTRSVGRHDA